MFRIDVVFKNAHFDLLKFSGAIHYSNLTDWENTLKKLPCDSNKPCILDFCEMTYLSSKAVEQLADYITSNTYIYNCSASIKNMMRSVGVSTEILN